MISIKKILVPIDFSTLSVPSIGYAGSLAKDHHAEIILLHVIQPETLKQHFAPGYGQSLPLSSDTPMNVAHEAMVENIFESKKQLVLGLLDQTMGQDFRNMVKIRALVKLGKVADEIIAAAKEERCDLIVMAANGSRRSRWFGARITERVVRHAPCPLLSMQPSAEVRTDKDERLQIKFIDQWAA
jgi:nucleotide-binding universal stress UspA family protein